MRRICTSILRLGLFGLAFASSAYAQTPRQTSRAALPAQALAILRDQCLACHGGQKMSGLDMRSRATLLQGGTRGAALKPGASAQSLLFHAIQSGKPQMPPSKKLSAAQIALLKRWIDAGAPWVSEKTAEPIHWAFQAPVAPVPPKVRNAARTPIDRFLLAKLEAKGLGYAPPADRKTLLRRLYFDVTGLPPSPEETRAFLQDKDPKAYEKRVEALLASPRYGERWARQWLDVARYAESNGFKTDEMRPHAWRYRDYVIASLNADKPYDRFLKEQIAGDELYPDSAEALVATGFSAHWPDESNAQDLRLRRQDILNDITEVTSATLLGLTLQCARCHDHKYDPIPQKDYYRFQAFFAGVRPRDDIALLTGKRFEEWNAKQSLWETQTKEIRAQLARLEEPVRRQFFETRKARFPAEVQQAIETPAPKRTSLQWLLYHKAMPQLEMTEGDVANGINGAKPEIKAKWRELRKQEEAFRSIKPDPMPLAQGVSDIGAEPPKTHLLAGGVYDKPREEVTPGFLSALTKEAPRIVTPRADTSGRRTALANWIASPKNPLTARVMVNRVWQQYFGRGIVATASDFGASGERPTHPELLDWLATEFMSHGWSLKGLHRQILLSDAYRQSAGYNLRAAKIDPDNRLVWRFRRRRLEGESIRDAMLATSGILNLQMGGVSVMPPLPADVTTRGTWKDAVSPQDRNRRSVYILVKRNLRYPLFEAFDMPDTHEPCARRQSTVTPLQALLLLNEENVLGVAAAFAGRVLREGGSDFETRLDRAYQLAFQRAPTQEERNEAQAFLARQEALLRDRPSKKGSLLLPAEFSAIAPEAGAAWVDLCHALLNANEFLYVE